jgi:hypothetical protein
MKEEEEEEEEEEDLCNGNNDSLQLRQELDQQMSRRTTMNHRSR